VTLLFLDNVDKLAEVLVSLVVFSKDEQVLADLHLFQMLVVSRQVFKCLNIIVFLDFKWSDRIFGRSFKMRSIFNLLQIGWNDRRE
jgi:flagellar biosynthesis regulator FlbT